MTEEKKRIGRPPSTTPTMTQTERMAKYMRKMKDLGIPSTTAIRFAVADEACSNSTDDLVSGTVDRLMAKDPALNRGATVSAVRKLIEKRST